MAESTYQQVTDRIIAELEKGAAPWIKPWNATAGAVNGADVNVTSGKAYRGINRMLLAMTGAAFGYQSSQWGTFKQWQEKGACVRKGEKAAHIVFFKPVAGKPKEATGDNGDGGKQSGYCVIRGYCVFNADQVDGLKAADAPIIVPTPEHERHAQAELVLARSGAVIRHGGDRAFYTPTGDAIQLPNLADFKEPSGYYATAMHELTHWTGAKHRLAREFGLKFGNPEYAFEELVAEMGAAFLCADLGIQGELRHAGYIQSWLKACRDNDRAIFKAASLAQNAADYIQMRAAEEQAQAA